MPDISVVILNYNTSSYTLKCVDKVLEKTTSELEIELIIIDNDSEEKDYQNLRNKLDTSQNVSLFRSNTNTGFGGGNNLGFTKVNSKYVLFLNNDAFLMNDCLKILYDFMEANANAGVGGAQNYDEHYNFVPSFDHDKDLRKMIFGRSFLKKIDPERYPDRETEYHTPQQVDWVNGAFLFLRTSDFQKIGRFDPQIFLFFEEMDICQRLRKLNKFAFLVPEAKILHYQGKSTGRNKRLCQEGLISFLYITKKNKGLLSQLVLRMYYIFTIIFKPKKWDYFKILTAPNPKKYSLRTKTTL